MVPLLQQEWVFWLLGALVTRKKKLLAHVPKWSETAAKEMRLKGRILIGRLLLLSACLSWKGSRGSRDFGRFRGLGLGHYPYESYSPTRQIELRLRLLLKLRLGGLYHYRPCLPRCLESLLQAQLHPKSLQTTRKCLQHRQ